MDGGSTSVGPRSVIDAAWWSVRAKTLASSNDQVPTAATSGWVTWSVEYHGDLRMPENKRMLRNRTATTIIGQAGVGPPKMHQPTGGTRCPSSRGDHETSDR